MGPIKIKRPPPELSSYRPAKRFKDDRDTERSPPRRAPAVPQAPDSEPEEGELDDSFELNAQQVAGPSRSPPPKPEPPRDPAPAPPPPPPDGLPPKPAKFFPFKMKSKGDKPLEKRVDMNGDGDKRSDTRKVEHRGQNGEREKDRGRDRGRGSERDGNARQPAVWDRSPRSRQRAEEEEQSRRPHDEPTREGHERRRRSRHRGRPTDTWEADRSRPIRDSWVPEDEGGGRARGGDHWEPPSHHDYHEHVRHDHDGRYRAREHDRYDERSPHYRPRSPSLAPAPPHGYRIRSPSPLRPYHDIRPADDLRSIRSADRPLPERSRSPLIRAADVVEHSRTPRVLYAEPPRSPPITRPVTPPAPKPPHAPLSAPRPPLPTPTTAINTRPSSPKPSAKPSTAKRVPKHRTPEEEFEAYSKHFHGCSRLSAYELLDKLGEGTFGEVHKARHREKGDLVAVKRILMHEEKEGVPITALREVKILKRLQHPSVVPVVDMIVTKSTKETRGEIYMVFPYMDHDLAGLLENKSARLTTPQIKLYMKQLLEGTEYLHRNNILHRDMKAANLLISNSGSLKIADFGLARPAHSRVPNNNGDLRKTRYTNCVVTRWYRPPELLMGENHYGFAIDIWGVGCVMGEMWLRRPLFCGVSDLNQLERIWSLCGTPTEETMPGWSQLPGCEGVKNFPKQERIIRKEFEHHGRDTADLIDQLLLLDPNRRITASQALDHEWFWTDPLPADPRTLNQYEASHEYDKRKVQIEEDKKRKAWQAAHPPLNPSHQYGQAASRPAVSYPGGPSGPGPRVAAYGASRHPSEPLHGRHHGLPPPPAASYRGGHYSQSGMEGSYVDSTNGYGAPQQGGRGPSVHPPHKPYVPSRPPEYHGGGEYRREEHAPDRHSRPPHAGQRDHYEPDRRSRDYRSDLRRPPPPEESGALPYG